MYIVIGANGFLGAYVVQSILEHTGEQVLAAYRDRPESFGGNRTEWIKCDVTDRDDVNRLFDKAGRIDECKIFYFAACHNLDLVKREPEFAKSVNITALENFLERFKNAKALYFSSTDCVYGENTDEFKKFREDDPKKPLNEYGRQKLEAEELVRRCGFSVARLPYMTGPSLLRHKKHFYDSIAEGAAKGEKFTLADGLRRSALDYKAAADILVKLINTENRPSVINVCGDRGMTKYDVGMMIAQNCKLPGDNIIKVPEAEIQKIFFEKRASSTLMDNSLLKSVLGVKEINISFN